MKSAGFDARGFLEAVTLGRDGLLPADSPRAGKFGRCP
jgi:hypothetical protein